MTNEQDRRARDLGYSSYQDYIDNDDGWQAFVLQHKRKVCQSCGITREFDLDCHHITYERLGEESEGDVVTLCKKCHKKSHRIARKENISLLIAHQVLRERLRVKTLQLNFPFWSMNENGFDESEASSEAFLPPDPIVEESCNITAEQPAEQAIKLPEFNLYWKFDPTLVGYREAFIQVHSWITSRHEFDYVTEAEPLKALENRHVMRADPWHLGSIIEEYGSYLMTKRRCLISEIKIEEEASYPLTGLVAHHLKDEIRRKHDQLRNVQWALEQAISFFDSVRGEVFDGARNNMRDVTGSPVFELPPRADENDGVVM